MPAALAPLLTGFVVSIGLIAAIGAQNLYVLQASISGHHAGAIAFVCFACDTVLMSLGVLGLAQIITTHPLATQVLAMVGCLFLSVYAIQSARSALKGGGSLDATSASTPGRATLGATIGITLTLTLLNPHVYLDTLVLVGSIGASFSGTERPYFLLGTSVASFVWFFGIALGGKMLRPLFQQSIA